MREDNHEDDYEGGQPMGTAYTPGLKVTRHTLIEKTRRLPIRGEILVELGARVKAEEVVAIARLSGDLETIRLGQVLGVDPIEVERYLRVREGATVVKGELIAEMKALFGLFKSSAIAPCDGTVEFFSQVTGHLGIRRQPVPIKVNAYIDGLVAEIIPGEGVVVRATGAMIQGIFGVGGEIRGQIKLCASSPEAVLKPEDLPADARGKVLVGGALAGIEVFRRAAELGAAGLITGGIIDRDLAAYLGYDLGVAITGHEPVPFTLIATEGFGQMAMARRTFDLLGELAGRTASINGATQIRAGAMRPEIIIPDEATTATPVADDHTEKSMELAIGTPIRVIRVPYFGALAQVTELPHELTLIETGAVVRVLKARLADGRLVTIPRANVEIIQS